MRVVSTNTSGPGGAGPSERESKAPDTISRASTPGSTPGSTPRRGIRSFVRREGRITPAQKRALAAGWPRYGLDPDGFVDLGEAFGRDSERVLEIGFGMGDALLQMAQARPDRDFIGIEVYEAGLGRLLSRLMAREVGNVRILRGDAAEVLPRCIENSSLAAVALYFPDPWPKKRHHKRRLVQPAFASLVAAKLTPGGRFLLATDWEDYAEHMLRVLESTPQLSNEAGAGCYSPRSDERPQTKFERRGERLGHNILDLAFKRDA